MIFKGDCLEHLKTLEACSIDSLVTDPPAGISFMGKEWDHGANFIERMTEIFQEVLRCLKPGGHGLVWALPRTSHWTATALERAGFEVRDVVTHVFGSGFPKSLDISKAIDKAAGAEREVVGKRTDRAAKPVRDNTGGNYNSAHGKPPLDISDITAPATDEAKQWQGWGTALKPAAEFWWLVRKPCSEKTVAANVLKWNCGGLNIDKSRIGLKGGEENPSIARYQSTPQKGNNGWEHSNRGAQFNPEQAALGRFPSNFVLSHNEDCDETCTEGCAVQKMGEPSRFFYCAKASKKDRGEHNNHPTVKSTKLMEYLITLITPPNGTVLDPFMGSGSTVVAAQKSGFKFVGIEKEDSYFEIAEKRIQSVRS